MKNLIPFLLLLVSCGQIPEWEPDTTPATYQLTLAEDMGVEYEEALEDAASSWNEFKGREIFTLVDSATPNVVLSEDIAPYFGFTTYTWFFGQEQKEDYLVEINPSVNWHKFSLRLLMLHELGHLLGLSHSDDPDNIMYPDFKPYETERDLD